MEQLIPTHAVKAVITNQQGDILFLQRNGAGRADGISSWDLPGGLVEEGEKDAEALKREVEEELQREAVIGHELGRWAFYRKFDGATVEVTNYAVAIDTARIEDLTLSDEHIGAQWVDKAALSNLDVKDASIFGALGTEQT